MLADFIFRQKRAGMICLSAYLIIGPTAILSYYRISSEAIIPALTLGLFTPLFCLLYAFEKMAYMRGSPLFPAPDRTKHIITKEQIRTEKYALKIGLVFIGFFVLVPVVTKLLNHQGLSLVDFAPAFVWAFTLRLMGWSPMRFGLLHMTRRKYVTADANVPMKTYITGLLLASPDTYDHEDWRVTMHTASDKGLPHVAIKLSPMASGSVTQDATKLEGAGLMMLITDNGDPYRLIHADIFSEDIHIGDLTSHEKVEALNLYRTTLNRLSDETLLQ